MYKTDYHEALANGHADVLERLAEQCSYVKHFNPLTTSFMTCDCDAEREFTWGSGSYTRRSRIREQWNSTYEDIFTLTKGGSRREYFVDCWRVRKTGKIMISNGSFPNGDLEGDRESLKSFTLYKVRCNYPKLSLVSASLGVVTTIALSGLSKSSLLGGVAGVFATVLSSAFLGSSIPINDEAIDSLVSELDDNS